MSAFMVSNESINRIVSWLVGLENATTGPDMYMKLHTPWHFDEQTRTEKEHELFHNLVAMNVAALHERYGDRARNMIGDGYKLSFATHADKWQVLKTLDCYLYQCSEGYVLEQTLFKQLDAVRIDLARVLASSTAEYNAAKWE